MQGGQSKSENWKYIQFGMAAREEVESPPLEVLKSQVEVALRDVVQQ